MTCYVQFSMFCECIFFLSSVGRNGSGKSNFFFGKFCILVTFLLAHILTVTPYSMRQALISLKHKWNLAFTKMRLTVQYVLTQSGIKSSCVKLILL